MENTGKMMKHVLSCVHFGQCEIPGYVLKQAHFAKAIKQCVFMCFLSTGTQETPKTHYFKSTATSSFLENFLIVSSSSSRCIFTPPFGPQPPYSGRHQRPLPAATGAFAGPDAAGGGGARALRRGRGDASHPGWGVQRCWHVKTIHRLRTKTIIKVFWF